MSIGITCSKFGRALVPRVICSEENKELETGGTALVCWFAVRIGPVEGEYNPCKLEIADDTADLFGVDFKYSSLESYEAERKVHHLLKLLYPRR